MRPTLGILLLAASACLPGCGEHASDRVGQPLRMASEEPPDPNAIRGEIVNLACYLRQGARGEAHRACAQACLKAGQPAGLLAESGEVLVLLPDPEAKEAIDFSGYAAQRCDVQGAVVKRGGLRGFLVKAIALCPAVPPPVPAR